MNTSMYIRDLGHGKHAVVCPWDAEHSTGESGDGSTVIFDGSNGKFGFRCQHSHCAGRTVKDVLKHFGHEARAVVTDGAQASLHFKSLKELFEEPPENIQWVVEDMLPAGGTSILAAKAKTGKTTLTGSLALSVANGTSFLSRATSKGPVLHLAVEEKKSEVVRRYKDQGATGDEAIFIHAAGAPKDTPRLLGPIIEMHQPKLVIVDTLFRTVHIENGNDYSEVTRALEPLNQLARSLGPHIMLVHHMGKADRVGSDGILGSMALQGAVDTMILMSRKDKYRTIWTDQRYGENLDETVLEFDETTRVMSLGSTRADVSFAKVEEKIVGVLKDSPGLLTQEKLLEAVGGKKQLVIAALDRLRKEGKILRSGEGRRNKPYQFAVHPNAF